MKPSVIDQVWSAAEGLAADNGMEILDIEYRREARGSTLRFYVDRVGGGVSSDDLATISRRLGDCLELGDTVPGPYILEVSSPGINRRLRQPPHFREFIGRSVRIRTVDCIDGRRVFAGTLMAVTDSGVRIRVEGAEKFIAFPQIAQANYIHQFPDVSKRRSRSR